MPRRPTDASRFLPLCTGALLAVFGLLACSDTRPAAWSGYAEGDYVYIATPLAGHVQSIKVVVGQSVAKDAPLFTLDAEIEQLAQQEAEARLGLARAQVNNLESGKRREELAVIQSQLAQAQANQTLVANDFQRQQQLVAQGFVAKARADDAQMALVQAQARVAELTAALQAAQLPGRVDERNAMKANVQAAQQALKQSQWRTHQKSVSAPINAQVADVFFQTGEWVPAGQPVVSLLSPGNIVARFFVPEREVGSLSSGQEVSVTCDGCGGSITARITRIATRPEFTPPVIYSNAQRAKLVFMVEARPATTDANRLKPGLPLDVRPLVVGTPSSGK